MKSGMKALLFTGLVSTSFIAAPHALAAADAFRLAQSNRATQVASAGEAQAALRLPSERMEARLAYARTALKISDAQQAEWENFANVLRRQAREMDRRVQERRAQGPRKPGSFTAIERLERAQQRAALRAARLNEVVAAAKPLYEALSPEQQQIADRMLTQRAHRRHGHRHHQHGRHRGT